MVRLSNANPQSPHLAWQIQVRGAVEQISMVLKTSAMAAVGSMMLTDRPELQHHSCPFLPRFAPF